MSSLRESTPLVVVGAGGMGRCVLDVVDAVNATTGAAKFEVLGVVDDATSGSPLLQERGVPHLGAVGLVDSLPLEVQLVIGIASPEIRQALATRLTRSGRQSPVLIHPNAHFGYGVRCGPGTVVCSHVSIESNVTLGNHVHVNQNSTIGHDSTVGDFSTVSPLAAISGCVRAGRRVFFGTGSATRQGVSIGDGAIVGMGSAVVGDVDAMTTVVGVPARPWPRQ